jgi:hypothetical protein
MTGEYPADLSWPFEGAVGPTSPVQQALEVLRTIIASTPIPEVSSREAYFVAPFLALHTLFLIEGAGQLNGMGYHSAAVSLFRSIEDALDCFTAVSLVPGAAERWLRDELKASDAAKLWVAAEEESFQYAHGTGVSRSEYRRRLRSQFNKYAHCSIGQTEWNLYIEYESGERKRFRLQLNLEPMVIEKNARSIDAHLMASVYELIELVEKAFSEYLDENEQVHTRLQALKLEIFAILQHYIEDGSLNVSRAPEIRHLAWST